MLMETEKRLTAKIAELEKKIKALEKKAAKKA